MGRRKRRLVASQQCDAALTREGRMPIDTGEPTRGEAVRAAAIAIAPNGGRRTKADHPRLPISPAELADCAESCLAAQASMIHVHVRDAEGRHCLDADRYRETIAAIRSRVGNRLIVQVTTESLGAYSPAEQIALVRELRPEAASIALRELVPDAAHEAGFANLLYWMRRERIFPQLILYDRADMERLVEFHRRGLLAAEEIPLLFVLGRYTTDQVSQPADLIEFLANAPHGFTQWTVCAFGRQEAACAVATALMGGNVRVGFENNLHLPNGDVAGSNAELVLVVTERLRVLGLPVGTADMQREALARIW
jgi:3-keto-5-aminohexanoate cleavage enzyme